MKETSTRRNRYLTCAALMPPVVLWGCYFVRGMYPMASWSQDLLLDAAAGMGSIVGGLLLVSGLFIVIVERFAPGKSTVGRSRRRVLLLLLIWAAGLLTLPLAGRAGLYCGGMAGVHLAPVQALRESPAVARIAASGNPADVPKADWPSELAAWDVGVYSISVRPVEGGRPELHVSAGSRGTRFHSVIIDGAGESGDTDDESFTPWVSGVRLGQRHDL